MLESEKAYWIWQGSNGRATPSLSTGTEMADWCNAICRLGQGYQKVVLPLICLSFLSKSTPPVSLSIWAVCMDFNPGCFDLQADPATAAQLNEIAFIVCLNAIDPKDSHIQCRKYLWKRAVGSLWISEQKICQALTSLPKPTELFQDSCLYSCLHSQHSEESSL